MEKGQRKLKLTEEQLDIAVTKQLWESNLTEDMLTPEEMAELKKEVLMDLNGECYLDGVISSKPRYRILTESQLAAILSEKEIRRRKMSLYMLTKTEIEQLRREMESRLKGEEIAGSVLDKIDRQERTEGNVFKEEIIAELKWLDSQSVEELNTQFEEWFKIAKEEIEGKNS